MEQRNGLYRSAHDSMIGGVAGGLAESSGLDPILFRILFVLMVLVGGSGMLLYVILWIVLPLNDQPKNNINSNIMEEQKTQENGQTGFQHNQKFKKKDEGSLIAGLILIALGVIFLVIRYVPRIDFGDLWPVILIVIGIVLLRNAYVGKK